jgi:hypothetical protein
MYSFYDESSGIVEYLYDRKNNRKGVMVACYNPSKKAVVCIGWSLTNTSAKDKFDRNKAIKMAYGRAIKWDDNPYGKFDELDLEFLRKFGKGRQDEGYKRFFVPSSIRGSLFAFIKRACRYFQGAILTSWVDEEYDYIFEVAKVKEEKHIPIYEYGEYWNSKFMKAVFKKNPPSSIFYWNENPENIVCTKKEDIFKKSGGLQLP